MSDAEVSQGLALDPFAHLPGIASRIAGLGGNIAGHDAGYAFHTAYVDVAPGYSEFLVKFDGLNVRQGTLTLRVHMLPKEEGAHAILATSQRASLNRIAQYDGEITVRFEAFRNVSYALYGAIIGDTDAEATALRIVLDRPAGTVELEQIVVDSRTSVYGRDAARSAPFMISLARPRLADPVCQLATAPQLAEGAARGWLDRPELANVASSARKWSAAYILQALSRFGMLTKDARGLATGWDAGAIAKVAAASGTDITLLEIGDDASPASDAPADAAFPIVRANRTMLGPEIVNYDFAWSSGTPSLLGSLADGFAFLREITARLRPGGLAVHTMAFNLSSYDDTIEKGATVLFRRCDWERISLTMISLGHEVAQIKIDPHQTIPLEYASSADGPRATLCGVLIRKAASAF